MPYQQNHQILIPPLFRVQCAQRRVLLKLLTLSELSDVGKTVAMWSWMQRKVQKQRLQLVQWSRFVHQIWSGGRKDETLNTHNSRNAEFLIYPGVTKRRKMFTHNHHFSLMVLSESWLMSCPRHLSLHRATR